MSCASSRNGVVEEESQAGTHFTAQKASTSSSGLTSGFHVILCYDAILCYVYDTS